MNTYGNANEHEIILSLIQLNESTSLPPDHGKSTNSNANEQSKSETGVTSQEPSCKKPFTEPGMLTKKEFTNTNSVFNIFISSNSFGDKNQLSSTSHRLQLNLCRKELSHVTLKDVVVDGGWVRTILASSKTKHI